MEGLGLPPTSQVINVAGKFLIVAPNTENTRNTLKRIQQELDDWFLQQTHGRSGIGFAMIAASCNDFVSSSGKGENRFRKLIDRLFEQLEVAKKQRLNPCSDDTTEIFSEYLDLFEKGECQVDEFSAAQTEMDGIKVSRLAKDQITIGKNLTVYQRVLSARNRWSIKRWSYPSLVILSSLPVNRISLENSAK